MCRRFLVWVSPSQAAIALLLFLAHSLSGVEIGSSGNAAGHTVGEREATAPHPSCSVVLWELCTWQLPWGNTNPWQLASFVQRGGRLELPAVEDLPGHDTAAFAASGGLRAYCELMAACWAQDPAQRPSFAELVPRLRWVGARGVEGVQPSRAGIHWAVSQRLACSAILLAAAVSEWHASSCFVVGSLPTRCLGFEEC